jgi:hypothetical protein
VIFARLSSSSCRSWSLEGEVIAGSNHILAVIELWIKASEVLPNR